MWCFIQDLSLNVCSYLVFFLHEKGSSFDNHCCFQQSFHELLAKNLHLSSIKIKHRFKWYLQSGLLKQNERALKRILSVLVLLKYSRKRNLWQSSSFRNITSCNNFSRVYWHFKKTANSSRKFLQHIQKYAFFV